MNTNTDQNMPANDREELDFLRQEHLRAAHTAMDIQRNFLHARRTLQRKNYDILRSVNPQVSTPNGANRSDSSLHLLLQFNAWDMNLSWMVSHRLVEAPVPGGNAFNRRSFAYYMPTLLTYAEPWERGLIRETELLCRKVRRRHEETGNVEMHISDFLSSQISGSNA